MKNQIEILGQPAASTLLSAQLRDYREKGRFGSIVLFSGPAGVGKTHSANTFIQAVQNETGADLIEVPSASDLCHSQSEAMGAMVEALKNSSLGQKTIIAIDEAQLLPISGSKKPSPVERVFRSLFFGAGEGWARQGVLEFSGEEIAFNSGEILIVLMTNFPDKIAKGNANAMARRVLSVELKTYEPEIMKQVISSYFDYKGIRVHADVRQKLIRFHRGTLEALDDFHKKSAGFPSPITMDSFKEIVPTCKFTVRGFSHDEVAALRWIAETSEPTIARYVAQKFPAVDIPALYRHAQSQRVKLKGQDAESVVPFLVMRGSRYIATDAAKAFLKTL